MSVFIIQFFLILWVPRNEIFLYFCDGIFCLVGTGSSTCASRIFAPTCTRYAKKRLEQHIARCSTFGVNACMDSSGHVIGCCELTFAYHVSVG